jgi:hypothetical protein
LIFCCCFDSNFKFSNFSCNSVIQSSLYHTSILFVLCFLFNSVTFLRNEMKWKCHFHSLCSVLMPFT